MTDMPMGYAGHLAHMGVMGLLVSIVAPALVLGIVRAAPRRTRLEEALADGRRRTVPTDHGNPAAERTVR